MSAYSTTAWRKTRATLLRMSPTCVLCGEPSRAADHWPLTRKQLVAGGIADPDDLAYLRALCIPCHNRKTATEDRPNAAAQQARHATSGPRWPETALDRR